MEQPQTFFTIYRFHHYSQPLKTVPEVIFNTLQTGFGNFDVFCLNAKGEVLGLYQSVVALGKLIVEHFCVFGTDAVKIVCLRLDGNAAFVVLGIGGHIEEGKLKSHRAVKVVEEIAPTLKNGGLVLILCKLIINIVKA